MSREQPRFGSWLGSTADLQREAFGAIPQNAEGDEWADYVTWNALALMTEMGELMQELPWRPWKRPRGKPEDDARTRAVVEMVDVLHFAANVLIALGVTDEELSLVYTLKQDENRARVEAGRSLPTATGVDRSDELDRDANDKLHYYGCVALDNGGAGPCHCGIVTRT